MTCYINQRGRCVCRQLIFYFKLFFWLLYYLNDVEGLRGGKLMDTLYKSKRKVRAQMIIYFFCFCTFLDDVEGLRGGKLNDALYKSKRKVRAQMIIFFCLLLYFFG